MSRRRIYEEMGNAPPPLAPVDGGMETTAEGHWHLIDRLTALLAAERAARVKDVDALKAVEPYLDAIACYASTITEHDGNRVAALVRAALTQGATT